MVSMIKVYDYNLVSDRCSQSNLKSMLIDYFVDWFNYLCVTNVGANVFIV